MQFHELSPVEKTSVERWKDYFKKRKRGDINEQYDI